MHDAHHFLVNLALVLCVAAVTTTLFQRLHQPVVLGYLLAGALVGPHTPFPLFADEGMIHALSELGVILLMFSLGLEFSFAKLFRVAPTAGVVAVIQCSLMVWLGYITGQLFGWTTLESLYTGALIAISSTTIIVKAFQEENVRGKLAEIVFGVLIVEDLIAIFLLAVLTTISAGAALTVESLAGTSGRLAVFLAIVIGGGLLVIPRLMRRIIALDRPETTVVASIGLCFALALLADAAGYSVALGAFLAGALVAESGKAQVVEHLVQPVRDIFAAIFFVAVGMLIDPALVAKHWIAVVVVTVVVVVGKLIGVAVGVFLTGQGIRTSIKAGMSLAQIGEFSFIIAGLGLSSGATGAFLYPLAVAVSAVTTLLTPWLIRCSDAVASYVDRHLPGPIQTLATLYGTWLEQLRTEPREPTAGRRFRQLGGWLVLDATLLAAVVIGTAMGGASAAAWMTRTVSISEDFTRLAVLLAAAAAAAPLCFGILRTTATLARELGSAVFPATANAADMADAPRRTFIVLLEVTILLVIGVPWVAFTQPFLHSFPGAGMLGLVLVVLMAALWRSARNLQAHARAGAVAVVEAFARQVRNDQSSPPNADLAQLHRLLPGLGAPVPIRLEAGAQAVGKTLAAINLRGLTGATVLAVVRDGGEVVAPTGRETLRVGDLLAVAGTREAIENAEILLGIGRPTEEGKS